MWLVVFYGDLATLSVLLLCCQRYKIVELPLETDRYWILLFSFVKTLERDLIGQTLTVQ